MNYLFLCHLRFEDRHEVIQILTEHGAKRGDAYNVVRPNGEAQTPQVPIVNDDDDLHNRLIFSS